MHERAETGFALKETKSYIKEQLKALGYTPKDCGKAGIVALIGKETKRCVMLRADIDALPMYENTGLPFACKRGNMHACGHDMHAAMLLGAAKLLKEKEKELKGCVKLLFQPAEEILEGAKDCIKAGVLTAPKPQAAFALHVSTGGELPTGTIVLSEYEKSVHFSDKALGEMMAFFRKDKRVKAVVFVSDHSHIPADKRGHNADQYSQEMTEIPMFVYLSPAYQQENRELVMRLRENRTAVFTNDLIFELMLSLWGIAPASRWNIGQNSYALDYTNARTLWGREKIRGRYTGIP